MILLSYMGIYGQSKNLYWIFNIQDNTCLQEVDWELSQNRCKELIYDLEKKIKADAFVWPIALKQEK